MVATSPPALPSARPVSKEQREVLLAYRTAMEIASDIPLTWDNLKEKATCFVRVYTEDLPASLSSGSSTSDAASASTPSLSPIHSGGSGATTVASPPAPAQPSRFTIRGFKKNREAADTTSAHSDKSDALSIKSSKSSGRSRSSSISEPQPLVIDPELEFFLTIEDKFAPDDENVVSLREAKLKAFEVVKQRLSDEIKALGLAVKARKEGSKDRAKKTDDEIRKVFGPLERPIGIYGSKVLDQTEFGSTLLESLYGPIKAEIKRSSNEKWKKELEYYQARIETLDQLAQKYSPSPKNAVQSATTPVTKEAPLITTPVVAALQKLENELGGGLEAARDYAMIRAIAKQVAIKAHVLPSEEGRQIGLVADYLVKAGLFDAERNQQLKKYFPQIEYKMLLTDGQVTAISDGLKARDVDEAIKAAFAEHQEKAKTYQPSQELTSTESYVFWAAHFLSNQGAATGADNEAAVQAYFCQKAGFTGDIESSPPDVVALYTVRGALLHLIEASTPAPKRKVDPAALYLPDSISLGDAYTAIRKQYFADLIEDVLAVCGDISGPTAQISEKVFYEGGDKPEHKQQVAFELSAKNAELSRWPLLGQADQLLTLLKESTGKLDEQWELKFATLKTDNLDTLKQLVRDLDTHISQSKSIAWKKDKQYSDAPLKAMSLLFKMQKILQDMEFAYHSNRVHAIQRAELAEARAAAPGADVGTIEQAQLRQLQEAHRAQLAEIEQRITALTDELAQARETNTQLSDNLEQARRELAAQTQLAEKLPLADGKTRIAETARDDNLRRVRELESQIGRLDADIRRLQQENQTKDGLVSEAQLKITQSEAAKKQADVQVTELDEQLVSAQRDLEQLRLQLTELSHAGKVGVTPAMPTPVTAGEAGAAASTEALAALRAQVHQLSGTLDDGIARERKLAEALAASQNETAAEREAREAANRVVERERVQLSAAEENVATLTQDLQQARAQISQLSGAGSAAGASASGAAPSIRARFELSINELALTQPLEPSQQQSARAATANWGRLNWYYSRTYAELQKDVASQKGQVNATTGKVAYEDAGWFARKLSRRTGARQQKLEAYEELSRLQAQNRVTPRQLAKITDLATRPRLYENLFGSEWSHTKQYFDNVKTCINRQLEGAPEGQLNQANNPNRALYTSYLELYSNYSTAVIQARKDGGQQPERSAKLVFLDTILAAMEQDVVDLSTPTAQKSVRLCMYQKGDIFQVALVNEGSGGGAPLLNQDGKPILEGLGANPQELALRKAIGSTNTLLKAVCTDRDIQTNNYTEFEPHGRLTPSIHASLTATLGIRIFRTAVLQQRM